MGTTPESRLRWLFVFLQADLDRATGADWATWRALLAGFPPPYPDDPAHRDTLADAGVLAKGPHGLAFGGATDEAIQVIRYTQLFVRAHLLTLADGRLAESKLGQIDLKDRLEATQGGPRRLRSFFLGSLHSTVLLAARDDLTAAGPQRLRRCLFEEAGVRCSRLFLSRPRQMFCSKEHTARAMYLRWRDRGSRRRRRPRRQ